MCEMKNQVAALFAIPAIGRAVQDIAQALLERGYLTGEDVNGLYHAAMTNGH